MGIHVVFREVILIGVCGIFLIGCGSGSGSSDSSTGRIIDENLLGSWRVENSCFQVDSGYFAQNFTYFTVTIEIPNGKTLTYRYQGYDDSTCLVEDSNNLFIEFSYSIGKTLLTDEGVEAAEIDTNPVAAFTVLEDTGEVENIRNDLQPVKQIYAVLGDYLYFGRRDLPEQRPTSLDYNNPPYRQSD